MKEEVHSTHTRIGYIDALKGFAILCVVLGHVSFRYMTMGFYTDAEVVLRNIFDIISFFHMPLFMMISGYIFFAAYFDDNGNPDRKRLKNQVYNLIGIYVIFGVLCGFSKFFAGAVVHSKVSLIDIVLIGIKPIDFTWYLYTLVLLYLIFLQKRIIVLNKWLLFGILIIAAVGGRVISIDWFSLSNLLYYSLYFFVGIAYRKNKNWILGNRFLAVALFCTSVVLCMLFWNERILDIPIVRIIVALGISLILWDAFEHIAFLGNCRFFKILGKYSLEIYLIHGFSLVLLELLFLRGGINGTYVSVILNLFISTLAPILISKICYKLGVHGLFFKPYTYFCTRHDRGRKEAKDNIPM